MRKPSSDLEKEKNHALQYYLEAEDDEQREEWMRKPSSDSDRVKEKLLPAIKASFLCYSQFNRDELMELLDKRIVPNISRRDPTIENF